MIERFYFTNPQQLLSFKPVLDGMAYEAEVKFRAGRWYLDLINQNSRVFCSVPVIASADNHDIQLIRQFKTKFVFRASSSAFEVEQDDNKNTPDFINGDIEAISQSQSIERFYFFYDKTKVFTFTPTLDGKLWLCSVKWCAGRWYVELKTQSNAVMAYTPLIASIDCNDIQIFPELISTNFVFRASSSAFEIGGVKKIGSCDKRPLPPAPAPPPPPVPTYAIVPDITTVDEGAGVVFTVTTTDVADGTILYYSTTGTAVAADFDDVLLTGSVTITGNTGSITRAIAADITTEGSETFALELRTVSITGDIVATSAVVTINDTSTATTPPTPIFECGVGGFVSAGVGAFVDYSAFYRYGRNLAVTFPPGIQAGDLLILRSTNNYVLTDFTPVAGASGVYYKIATGLEVNYGIYFGSGHPNEYSGYTSNLMAAFRGLATVSVVGSSSSVVDGAYSTICIPGITLPQPGILLAVLLGWDTTTYNSASMTLIANFQDSYSSHVSQAMFYAYQGVDFTGNRLIYAKS